MTEHANPLVFNKTMSVEDFKASIGTKVIKVKELNAGSLSMLNDLNQVVGSVSIKKVGTLAAMDKPVVSEVTGDPTERNPSGVFFMLHQLGENTNAIVLAEF